MNTLETDIAEYLAHLRAQLEQIEREVTKGPWTYGSRVERSGELLTWVTTKIRDICAGGTAMDTMVPDEIHLADAAFIANARSACPASIAREIRLVGVLLGILRKGAGNEIWSGLSSSLAAESALRDIIAEWKGGRE